MNWHKLTIPEVFDLLGTSQFGITSVSAEERWIEYGRNELDETKAKSIWIVFLEQFKDVLIVILLVAAFISYFVGDIIDTIVILIIVLLTTSLGLFQQYRAENAIRLLKKMSVPRSKVLRNGVQIFLPSTDLVVGDIVFLEVGNAVPADIRLIESTNLKVDESALSGESNPVFKITPPINLDNISLGDKINMAFKGTFITYGRGVGIIIAVGMQTELGRIAKLLQENELLTPLQQRMVVFGKKITLLVLFLCFVFFFVGWYLGEDLSTLILTSISLAVAAIPEALPSVITISLALAARKMIRFNCLIRRLPAVETLGSVKFICTDKTGTLTKNSMQVEEVFMNGQLVKKNNFLSIPQQFPDHLLLPAIFLNNDIIEVTTIENIRDSTEKALMKFLIDLKINMIRSPRMAEIPFDANRKLMTTFHVINNQLISFTKGAPDILIQKCIAVDTDFILQQVDEMALKGYRVLGFSYRYWDAIPSVLDSSIHESALNFLGLIAMIDPPRDEVVDAIAQCKLASIITVMITGDYPVTAKTIAQRIGIINSKSDLVITGQQLSALNDENFLSIIESVKVYARVTPEQKLHIVKMIQQKGHYVAMTGDGVNDAPSLKRANIGIAMGITGTDVSKEAAHMILLDDNFSTIVLAVKEGRRIYDNILKVIKYLMTTNSGELWTLLIGPLIGLPIALLPIHILWINLVSDGLPAIALSFEKAEKGLMNKPPRSPSQTVFANKRGIHIVWVGLLMAVITLFTQHFSILYGFHWQTIVFNVLCISQIGHLLAIRSDGQSAFSFDSFSNPFLIGTVLLTLLLQFSVTYLSFFQSIFKTDNLSFIELLIVFIASSIVFFAVEIEKLILRFIK